METIASSSFLIRPARIDDASGLADLTGQLGYPTSTTEMTQRLRELLPLECMAIRVACAGERVVGWAAVERRTTLEGGPRFELVGLVVDSTRRRRGAGRQLLAAAETWAVRHGARQLMLRSNVVREHAHAFYERAGYARAKSQHVLVRDLTG